MYFTGIIIAVCTFLIIGFFHPIVIKAEYYTGTRLWWLFLIVGLVCIGIALFIVYFVGKRMLAKEIAAEEKQLTEGK